MSDLAATGATPMKPHRVVVFHDPHVSLGIACRLMMDRPAFARLPFGALMGVTLAQIERGHVRFFLDSADVVVGFFGYALCDAADAEAWAFRDAPLADADCRSGDHVVINAWVGGDEAARSAMLEEARRVTVGKVALFYKRFYPDGRIRPVRLPRTCFHQPP